MPLIGEYALEGDTLSVIEDDGRLRLLHWHGASADLRASSSDTLEVVGEGRRLIFLRTASDRVSSVVVDGNPYPRLTLGAEDGGTFRIEPLRPPDELRAVALAASPPAEEGSFLDPDLVQPVALDSSIHLDVRYATTNNFMGEVFYSRALAFLQRPAAEALIRAHRWLETRGYGLLIHDAYRPWYVTRMFWDATPESLRVFVANPSSGSRHNRGAAVDLTLYDRDTGAPVEMPGGYDEFSPRSYPDYPGGTSRQRWHRELLREAMEREGFTVYEAEWWHFDFDGWQRYRIGNERFEDLLGS
ncbi:MAG: M15 family metallopeptidase [Gemmatimonadota bacterium]